MHDVGCAFLGVRSANDAETRRNTKAKVAAAATQEPAQALPQKQGGGRDAAGDGAALRRRCMPWFALQWISARLALEKLAEHFVGL